MSQLLQNLVESIQNPQEFHAMLGHWPIVLSLLGLAPLVLLALTAGRWSTARWACVGLYVLGAAMAIWVMQAGESAASNLPQELMTAHAKEYVHDHEELGELVWLWLGLTGFFAAVTVFRQPWVRLSAVVVALLFGLFAAGWVGTTAWYGGSLVYEHGVGAPRTANNFPPATSDSTQPRLDHLDAEESSPRAVTQPGTATQPSTAPHPSEADEHEHHHYH